MSEVLKVPDSEEKAYTAKIKGKALKKLEEWFKEINEKRGPGDKRRLIPRVEIIESLINEKLEKKFADQLKARRVTSKSVLEEMYESSGSEKEFFQWCLERVQQGAKKSTKSKKRSEEEEDA